MLLLQLLLLLLLQLLLLLLLLLEQLPLDLGQRGRDIGYVGLLVALRRRGRALLELLGELADVRGAAGEDVELLDAGVALLEGWWWWWWWK